MTEEEWLVCHDPDEMLKDVGPNTFPRKLRLFACACFRAGEPWDKNDADVHDTLVAAEGIADALLSDEKIRSAIDNCVHKDSGMASPIVLLLLPSAFHAAVQGSQLAADFIGLRAEHKFGQDHMDIMPAERIRQTGYLRDVFGQNPFRPVAFLPEWRTESTVLLARWMYESRDFSAMPILADALQEAGCNQDDILSHCRNVTHPHVRGCWVVDFVLGKA